jgi:hypothetical protein
LGVASHASGQKAYAEKDRQFVWNGIDADYKPFTTSGAGIGTFCVNPQGGINGIYVGSTNLTQALIKLIQSDANVKAAFRAALGM